MGARDPKASPGQGRGIEPDETPMLVSRDRIRGQSRRAFLGWGAGAFAATIAAWWLLPDRARARLTPFGAAPLLDRAWARIGLTRARRDQVLDHALTFDDDVAEALFSRHRRVRTYDRSLVTALPNNYHGRTPGPEALEGWRLTLTGLASGDEAHLGPQDFARFRAREQVTRLVCVEGWSAIAWWGGFRFAELLAAFPPARDARWAGLRSEVSLDSAGRKETYHVSLDLETARHEQTLLATHLGGKPLPLAHGAPLRLVAPMKLGLKNIKAITHIDYTAAEPSDYWAERGYSRYDGL